jgi:uncharacterized protein
LISPVLSPRRPLGATGVTVPLIGYGAGPLGKKKVSQEDAVRCLNHAIHLGVTYIDTSPDYGSGPFVGQVMRTRRDEVFLATKVNRRSKRGVLDEIKESLEQFQTDHVDLIQIHSVEAWADLELAFAPEGAVAALEQARGEGLVQFIGITGHARPELLARALAEYRFDTVLVALGMADRLVTNPETFLLPIAVKRNIGAIAMKVLGHGTFSNRELALRYSLGLQGVSLAIVGMHTLDQIDEIAAIAAAYRPLEQHEERRLTDEVRPLVEKDAEESNRGRSDLFWLHDTSVMGWQKHDEPAKVNY